MNYSLIHFFLIDTARDFNDSIGNVMFYFRSVAQLSSLVGILLSLIFKEWKPEIDGRKVTEVLYY